MGRSTLNRLLIILFIPFVILGQVGYVEISNPVYQFLERMYLTKTLDEFNNSEIPLTREKIAKYLSEIKLHQKDLTEVDKKILDKFFSEFSFEINGKENLSQLIPTYNFDYLLSAKEKYLYSFNDSSDFNFYLNGLLSFKYITKSTNSFINNVTLVNFGLSLRGTFYKNFGFYLKATNGTYLGSRKLAQSEVDLRYNFKFTKEKQINLGQDYFDFTEGFLMYENDLFNVKIGRDRKNFGYGFTKVILGNSAPQFDYLSFRLTYKSFDFSYLHGKLLGEQSIINDSIYQPVNSIKDKYFVYHRFGLNITNNLNAGFGEIIIYSDRSYDLAYLNPFNFYKSIEHSNQDRDNSMLFFDIKVRPFWGSTIYSNFFIDDLDFGKLGTDWYGNKFLFNVGADFLLYNNLPIIYSIQYIKIDPYFYTHHIKSNNYTNYNYNLSNDYQPNSAVLNNNIKITLTEDIELNFRYTYSIHGANVYDDEGQLLINYGGNILDGHRIGDKEYVSFLSGKKEMTNEFEIYGRYEFIKNYFLSFQYLKRDTNNKLNDENNFSLLSISLNCKI